MSTNTVKLVSQYPQTKTLKKKGLLSNIRVFFSNLDIAKKISYGYCLAIGVGLTGTSIGLFLGDHYQTKALSELRLAEQQQSTIVELKSSLTIMQAYPQQIMTVLGDPISLDYEQAKIVNHLNSIQDQIQQFNTTPEGFVEHLTINDQDIQVLEQAYHTTIKSYVAWIDAWWIEMNLTQLESYKIAETQQQIWQILSSDRAKEFNLEFKLISEYLTQLNSKARLQEKQAYFYFEQANMLRFKIIFFSLFLSTLIAIILAFLTSSAIANPIKNLTQVAKSMTEDGNLSQRAIIQSQDEVGRLAKSLNQLIQWVETYTDELEIARQTLEERVDERTQELKQTLQELKTTQAQLIHTEKMSGLGQMIAGIAHEINNPINFISANLTYLNEYIDQLWGVIEGYQAEYSHPSEALQTLVEDADLEFIQEDLNKILTSMKTGSHRIRDIVISLRTFSRLDEAETKFVDLHAGLESALMLLKHRLEAQNNQPTIQVIRDYGDLPQVNCHASHLNQVFMHLLNNAVDALRAKTFSDEQPTLKIKTQMTSKNWVQISVQDNGIGMEPAIIDHIFDPFFTTKPIGSGTGLGLSTSYQIIVEQHQGRLSCTSILQQGTTFLIEIPTVIEY